MSEEQSQQPQEKPQPESVPTPGQADVVPHDPPHEGDQASEEVIVDQPVTGDESD